MPDETINYKVNVDTSSLADQLQQIKNQVDQAMATYTFSATRPDPVPLAYAFPSEQLTSQIAATSSNAASAALDTGRDLGHAVEALDAHTTTFVDSARLGFQKFTHDVQNTMLMTPVGAKPQFAQQIPGMAPPQFQTMSGARLGFEAVTGFGYDTNSSMTPGRYQRMAREAFSDRSMEMLLGGLDFAAGATTIGGFAASMLGMTGTAATLGTAAALLAPPALLAGAGMATFGYDVNAALRGRAFMRDASPRFLSGPLTAPEYSALGTQIATAARDPELIGKGISQGEAMADIQMLTQMGGYDMVRSAEDLRKRIKTDLKDLTDVQKILGVTKEEAGQILIDTNRMGLRPTENFAAGIQAQAYQAGYTGAEFNRFGLQAAEMARGTGIMMGSAYLGGQDALADVRNMMRTGAIPLELINQLGGQENAAATINRMGSNFGLSPTGLTYFAARDLLGPKAASMDPLQTITAATQRIQSIPDFLSFRGAQARMTGQVGPEALFNAETAMFLNEFKMLQQATPNLKLTEDTWAGFMQQKGEADPIARLRFSMIGAAAGGAGAKRAGGEDAERARLLDENRPGQIQLLTDIAKNTLAKAFQTEAVAEGATEVANWFDRTIRTVERAGQRGDILGGLLDSVTGQSSGLGAFARAIGYDSINTPKVAYNERAVLDGLRSLAPETQKRFFGNTFDHITAASGIIARDVLDIKTTDIWGVQAKLATVPATSTAGAGVLPYTDGSPEEKFKAAMNEWKDYAETVKIGTAKGENRMDVEEKKTFDRARAVMVATGDDPAKFVAAVLNPVGAAGQETRKYLTPLRELTPKESVVQVAEKVIAEFNTAFDKAFPLTKVAQENPWLSAKVSSTKEVDLLEARNLFKKIGADATEGQSMAQAVLTKREALGPTEFKTQLFNASVGMGTVSEREDRVQRIVADVDKFRESKEVKQLMATDVLARLSTEGAKDYIVEMSKAMGKPISKEELSNAAGLQNALLKAPGQLQKLAINYADASTYISTNNTTKDIMDQNQKTLRTNLAQSEVALWETVKGINADLSTVTTQQIQEAKDKLMVSSLVAISNTIRTGTQGTAMNVKVINKDDKE